MRKRKDIIKYAEIGDDAMSLHKFSCDQIFKLDELKNAINKLKFSQAKGSNSVTEDETRLLELLTENRLLWPIVRKEMIELNILSADQIEIFDNQKEFGKYKTVEAARKRLEKEMQMTRDFLSKYPGPNKKYLEMKKALEIHDARIIEEKF